MSNGRFVDIRRVGAAGTRSDTRALRVLGGFFAAAVRLGEDRAIHSVRARALVGLRT